MHFVIIYYKLQFLTKEITMIEHNCDECQDSGEVLVLIEEDTISTIPTTAVCHCQEDYIYDKVIIETCQDYVVSDLDNLMYNYYKD